MTSLSGSSSSSSIWNRVVIAILVTETAERVAYFGFRAILVLYFHHGLGLSESVSVSLYAAVACGAYFSPLVGALLADASWGRYHTIWSFSSLYTVGLCLLTLGAYHVRSNDILEDVTSGTTNEGDSSATKSVTFEKVATLLGLFLVCVGTGGIKPCVSAFGADQIVLRGSHSQMNDDDILDKHSKHSDDFDESLYQEKVISTQVDVTHFFNSFYFCINLGALSSFAIIPIIRANFGFGPAFLVPTVFMSIALTVFLSQRKLYKHRVHDSSQPPLSLVLRTCLTLLMSRRPRHHVLVPTSEEMGQAIGERGMSCSPDRFIPPISPVVYEDALQVLHLMPLMLFFPIFWMLYDQQGSVWTLQATRLKLHGLQPEQLQFLNPLQIMIFIPLFDRLVYPCLRRLGIDIQPLRRIEYGMGLTVISFLASALVEYLIQTRPPNSISLCWQIPQITIITAGEILLNVTGLEFAYSQAPGNMQALILAMYLFMTAIGDGLAALLFATVFSRLSTAVTMVLCAIAMVLNMLFFHVVARRWTPYKAIQTDLKDENNDGLQLGLITRGEKA
jgi:proton-dependent oligopeptide transporter, POT family